MRFAAALTAALAAAAVAGFEALVASVANHYLDDCDVTELEEYIDSCFKDGVA